MIVFDLECSEGHIFEGWFNDIESFEKQNAGHLVSCPYCNDTKIRRVISPVAMKTSASHVEKKDENSIDYIRLAKEIVDYFNKNFEDTGPNFAKEALKIHYGVAEKRNIKGSATSEEEKILKEEGIQFIRVPIPKMDEEKKN